MLTSPLRNGFELPSATDDTALTLPISMLPWTTDSLYHARLHCISLCWSPISLFYIGGLSDTEHHRNVSLRYQCCLPSWISLFEYKNSHCHPRCQQPSAEREWESSVQPFGIWEKTQSHCVHKHFFLNCSDVHLINMTFSFCGHPFPASKLNTLNSVYTRSFVLYSEHEHVALLAVSVYSLQLSHTVIQIQQGKHW